MEFIITIRNIDFNFILDKKFVNNNIIHYYAKNISLLITPNNIIFNYTIEYEKNTKNFEINNSIFNNTIKIHFNQNSDKLNIINYINKYINIKYEYISKDKLLDTIDFNINNIFYDQYGDKYVVIFNKLIYIDKKIMLDNNIENFINNINNKMVFVLWNNDLYFDNGDIFEFKNANSFIEELLFMKDDSIEIKN